ncbi:MAG: PASTA domain-containing protein [Clostridia bacterium]|nr:PASTA domain-containing protein [Clostridia bacterium]
MKDNRADLSTVKRLRFVLIFALVLFAAVIARLFYMQVINHDFYEQKAAATQMRDKTLYPARGTIYDTNMKPLAISASTEMFVLMGNKVKDDAQRAYIAENISEMLGMEYSEVFKKTQETSSYVVIARGIEKDAADKVRAFIRKNEGFDRMMYFQNDATRYYPYGSFLSHVLGFVGADEQGLFGIEKIYDEELSGTVGRSVTATNPRGDEMPFEYEVYYEAKDGNSLVLTIDEVLQHYLEKNLEIAYKDNKVRQSTVGVVMDVNTGGILAMASYPEFDLNDPFTIADPKIIAAIEAESDPAKKEEEKKDALYKQWNNKAVSFTYYPGSTFKIITASTALEQNVVNENSTFKCSGRYTVSGRSISCWKSDGSHGTQTLGKAIQNSCNPAFMQIGFKIGKENFTKYVGAFGLREKTGIDLPGEAVGLYNLKQDIDLAVYSFGQNFTITPIQLITAVSAVANGGTLLKPYLVKEIVDQNGNTVKSFGRNEVRQVVSEDTSKRMCKLLEDVVTYGTGKNAYVAGYRVCGKTGTTEKIADQIREGRDDLRVSSFIAFAPANDPKIAVLILLDEPMVKPVTGGLTVAPVVRRFLTEAMPYLGVEPQYTEEEMKTKNVTVPNLVGLSLDKADAALKTSGLKSVVRGTGGKVTDQRPAAGSIITNTANVILYLGGTAPDTPVTMPDLSGMTLERAQKTLQSLGLFAKVDGAKGTTGNIIVTKQNVESGQTLKYGDVVTIELSDMDQRAG